MTIRITVSERDAAAVVRILGTATAPSEQRDLRSAPITVEPGASLTITLEPGDLVVIQSLDDLPPRRGEHLRDTTDAIARAASC